MLFPVDDPCWGLLALRVVVDRIPVLEDVLPVLGDPLPVLGDDPVALRSAPEVADASM